MENDRVWTLLTRKLSGAATTTELMELDELIAGDAAGAKIVSEVSSLWTTATATDPDFLEATYLQHLERMKARGFYLNGEDIQTDRNTTLEPANTQATTTTPLWKRITISVSLVTLLTATWWVLKKPEEVVVTPVKKELGLISTNKGTRTKLILPDGSSVWLNSGSNLTYDKNFDKGAREVNLVGEAFFDVTKNTARPFVIHTAKMDIKVTGTQFNVKAYDEDKTSETSLIDGSVEVYLHSAPQKKYVLKPNEKLVFNQAEPTVVPGKQRKLQESAPFVEIRQLTYLAGNTADVESSWTRNILAFEDEPFSEVSKKMERWYDVRFQFKNKRWENEFLSGSFEKESLEQAMTALQFSTGFNFRINDKTILIY